MKSLPLRLLVRLCPLWCAKQEALDGEQVCLWATIEEFLPVRWHCRIGTRRHAVTAPTPRAALLAALSKPERRVRQSKVTPDSKLEKGTP